MFFLFFQFKSCAVRTCPISSRNSTHFISSRNIFTQLHNTTRLCFYASLEQQLKECVAFFEYSRVVDAHLVSCEWNGFWHSWRLYGPRKVNRSHLALTSHIIYIDVENVSRECNNTSAHCALCAVLCAVYALRELFVDSEIGRVAACKQPVHLWIESRPHT